MNIISFISIEMQYAPGALLVIETNEGWFSIIKGSMPGNNIVLKGCHYDLPGKITDEMICSDEVNIQLFNQSVKQGVEL